MNNRSPRWMALAAVGAAAAALLVACGGGGGTSEEVDGDLTDGWAGLAAPVSFVPAEQVCHPEAYRPAAALAEYQPVACDQPHLVETVHVGTFPAEAAADLDAPPAPDSDAQRRAYRVCEKQAREYLGADFRRGRLWLGVATPSQPGWDGGARWFRCDLMEVESVYGEPVKRESSLAGALSERSSLSLGCYRVEVDDEEVRKMTPVGCDKEHQAEFVGVWRAPNGGYLDHKDGDAESKVYEGCRERVAEYVDVPADGDLVYRTGAIADWMSEQDWAAGDRAFRCYLWLPGRDLTESLRDAGTEALPVQTE